MKKWTLLAALFVLLAVLAACGNDKDDDAVEEKPADVVSKNEDATKEQDENGEASEGTDQKEVQTTFKNSDDKDIGTATLTQSDQGVDIKLDLHDVPAGVHGFHVHEKGTCTGPDFKSAGDHFNPTNKKHGVENPEGPHAGDLPNLTVNDDGKVKEEILAEMVTLEKGLENSLLKEGGTALVIHAEADDNKSQPAGDAGDRIACAEIK